MTDLTDRPTQASGSLQDRGFWGVFAAAWAAYAVLFFWMSVSVEGEDPSAALGYCVLSVAPPAFLAWLVALRRRELLRPERSLPGTIALTVGVGLAYALASTGIMTAILVLLGLHDPGVEQVGLWGAFVFRAVFALFLFAILAGFLMWSESLRRVHESRTLAAREAVLRAQAEARAVRAQFNPHFVFNTLHSLMLLVRADPATAERAIEDVATLIRYASILQRRGLDTVPLSKELEVARRYTALEGLRLEDRLRVEMDVRVDPERVALPPFALQTLVENAIKHGLEPAPEGGTVTVRVDTEGADLVVTVSDDGAGADPAAVSRASDHGLDLLSRRLSALYGPEAALSWSTAPGQGFEATLRLPARAPAETRALEVIQPVAVR